MRRRRLENKYPPNSAIAMLVEHTLNGHPQSLDPTYQLFDRHLDGTDQGKAQINWRGRGVSMQWRQNRIRLYAMRDGVEHLEGTWNLPLQVGDFTGIRMTIDALLLRVLD